MNKWMNGSSSQPFYAVEMIIILILQVRNWGSEELIYTFKIK